MSIVKASSKFIDAGKVTPVLSLKDYFSEERELIIPPWQREYTWSAETSDGQGEVQQLLRDLSDFVESGESEYLLGVVTLSLTEDPSDINSLYIVDGQQRTVTLLIFFMCCLEYLIRQHNNKFPQEIANFIVDLKRMIGLERAHNVDMRVTFSHKDANTILQTVHTWAISSISDVKVKNKMLDVEKAKNPTEERLLEVRSYITEVLENDKHRLFQGNLLESIKKIMNNSKVIELTLDNHDEAIEVYDRMNDRGRRLSAADLIKNRLFMETSNKEFGQVSSHWNRMIETLQDAKKAKISDPVFLVRSHASMFWGKTHKEKTLAALYKKSFFDGSNERTPVKFATLLADLAAKGTSAYSGESYESLFTAQFLGVNQHFPLILAGLHIDNFETRKYYFDQVGTRAALAAFSKEFPPQLEHIFPKWANTIYDVAKDNKHVSKTDLDEIYRNFAFKRSDEAGELEMQKYLTERIEDLKTQFNEWRYASGSQKRKIRAALGLMSWWVDKKCGSTHPYKVKDYFASSGSPAWEIDHVAASAWESSLVDQLSKDSIGNLVLLDPVPNRGAGADAPELKRDLYTHSGLLLTKKLASKELINPWQKTLEKVETSCELKEYQWDLDSWDVHAVEMRQKYYLNLMIGILSRKVSL